MTPLFRAARLESLLSVKSMAAALLIAVTALMAGCGNETLASISVGPPDATLAAGLTSQYVATGIYSDGTKKDLSSQVTWSSSTPAAATISSAGLATAVSAGSSTITATLGTFSGTTKLTVTGVTLVSIEVTPTNPSIGIGATEQFSATGVYSDNSTQNLTPAVTWNSATPGVATISSAGLAASVAVGSSVITATYKGVSGTTTLTVTAATLVSIGITPATATLAKGTTQQFVATGVYTDHSTHVLTTSVTWASSAPGVATISNTAGTNGLAKALTVGPTAITASLGGVTSPAVTLTVSAATLVSIGVTPAAPSLPLGSKLQFVATGTYSDNSTQVITTSVTWTSSAPAIATISNAVGFDGLASAVALGTTSITATLGSVTSTPVTLTVTAAALASIGITPANPTIHTDTTEQFVAMGVYTDNSTQVLTTAVTWKSATPTVATISNASPGNGLATAVAAGTTVITATLGSVTSTPVTLTVSPATLVTIAVTPATPSIAKGLTQSFVATGTYSDATTQVITTTVTWASGTPATATISNTAGTNGIATGLAIGTTAITASQGTVTSPPVTLTVTAATLVSIAVTAPTLSVPVLLTDQFTATGTYTDNSTQIITTSVTWTSGTPATATISNTAGTNGLATTLTTGTTAITAAVGAITSTPVTLTVTAATLVSIAVTPASPGVPLLATQQFTATGTYNNNTTLVITNSVTWASATAATATISNTGGSQGLATSLATGTTAITATLGSVTSPAVTLKVGEYVYVSDYLNGLVYEYSVGANGALTALATPTIGAGTNPSGMAVDPTGHYLYVTNEYAGVNGTTPGTISQYTIGTNGALTANTTPTVTAGVQPSAITIDPTGTYAYVANFNNGGAGTVSQYTIGTGGVLMPMTNPTVTVGNGPSAVALDPTAAFAYVSNYTDGTIMVFTVGAGGALSTTPVSMVTLTGTAPINPNSVVIDPTGSYLYAADYADNGAPTASIGQFSINPTTGALTPLTPPYIAQRNRTISLHQSPTSAATFVYASDYGGDTEAVYQIGTGGNLGVALQSYTFTAGYDPQFIAFDPSGKYAYVADRLANSLSQFSVSATTGGLTALTPATVPLMNPSTPLFIVTTSGN